MNIHAAKTHLSRLVDEAAKGGDVIIARTGRPVAHLTAPARPRKRPETRLADRGAGVVRLPIYHRDPFDRLLIAQATAEPARLLTVDDTLARYSDLVEVARR